MTAMFLCASVCISASNITKTVWTELYEIFRISGKILYLVMILIHTNVIVTYVYIIYALIAIVLIYSLIMYHRIYH